MIQHEMKMQNIPIIAITSPKRRLGRSTVAHLIASLATRWGKTPVLVNADPRGAPTQSFPHLELAPCLAIGPYSIQNLRRGFVPPAGTDLAVLDLPPLTCRGVAEICKAAMLTIVVLPTLPRAIALARITNRLAPSLKDTRAFLINALPGGVDGGEKDWHLVMNEGRTCPFPIPNLNSSRELAETWPSVGHDRILQIENVASWLFHHARAACSVPASERHLTG